MRPYTDSLDCADAADDSASREARSTGSREGFIGGCGCEVMRDVWTSDVPLQRVIMCRQTSYVSLRRKAEQGKPSIGPKKGPPGQAGVGVLARRRRRSRLLLMCMNIAARAAAGSPR